MADEERTRLQAENDRLTRAVEEARANHENMARLYAEMSRRATGADTERDRYRDEAEAAKRFNEENVTYWQGVRDVLVANNDRLRTDALTLAADAGRMREAVQAFVDLDAEWTAYRRANMATAACETDEFLEAAEAMAKRQNAALQTLRAALTPAPHPRTDAEGVSVTELLALAESVLTSPTNDPLAPVRRVVEMLAIMRSHAGRFSHIGCHAPNAVCDICKTADNALATLTPWLRAG